MVDLWSEQEFYLMQAPLENKKLEEEQLRNDYKTYTLEDRGYSWRQTQEDMEITFEGHPVTAAEAKAARIAIQRTRLKVELKGQVVFDDELWETVRSDESTWTVCDGVVVVQLVKVPLDPPEKNNWPRCGKSEPHKYEKEYKARQARKEARRQEREERLIQEALAEAAAATEAEAPAAAEEAEEAKAPRWDEVRGAGSELEERLRYRLVRQGERTQGLEETPAAASPSAASRPATAAGEARGQPEAAAGVAEAQELPAEAPLAPAEALLAPAEASPTPAEASPTPAEARPPRRRANATTGTAAERERLKREQALKEERKWKQGTSEESWLAERRKVAGYLGPLPAAESWRREGRREEVA